MKHPVDVGQGGGIPRDLHDGQLMVMQILIKSAALRPLQGSPQALGPTLLWQYHNCIYYQGFAALIGLFYCREITVRISGRTLYE